jgi:DNA-directed RNA polymerase specialized sigma24 family protein
MTKSLDPTLDALMARLAEGDRSAFSPVFERLWPPALRLCANMLKNDADAADAAQHAMEKILVRASDYDPSRPALPWALAIASWECRTILRRRFRRREISDDSIQWLAAGVAGGPAVGLVGSGPLAEEEAHGQRHLRGLYAHHQHQYRPRRHCQSGNHHRP